MPVCVVGTVYGGVGCRVGGLIAYGLGYRVQAERECECVLRYVAYGNMGLF